MKGAVMLAVLVGVVVLVVYGVAVSESLSFDVSRFFTGSPADRMMRLLIGEIAAIIFGAAGLLRRQTK